MQQDKPRILIISSVSLSVGPAVIAGQYYEALKQEGLDVDLLLKKPEPGRPDILYVQKNSLFSLFWIKIIRRVKYLLGIKTSIHQGYNFYYKKENNPPVPSAKLLKKITKQYDLVYVVFWQGLLSFESIWKIYEKLHCQIQFAGVDYSQMGGGCHFTNGCERYIIGCGCCPAYDSQDENDFTAWNVRYREKVYKIVRPIVFGNQYMLDFYKRSYLLKNARCELNYSAIIDTNIFKPLNKERLRIKHNIPIGKRFVVFFACQRLNEKRKGMSYLIEALNILRGRLKRKANELLILMAGKNDDEISNNIPFDYINVGYVSMTDLPEIFSLSTLFVCPSVDDAGPMMVGQSLCCGTPVVGFDMGAIKQFVKNRNVGICVPLKDSRALAAGIEEILSMPKDYYDVMSINCRKTALKYCSYEAQARRILEVYQKYRNI